MIDWQSYLDGTMAAADRAQLDARIEQEPAIKVEFEGFKAFRAALVIAGSSVQVPTDKLLKSLSNVAGAPVSRPRFQWRWAAASAAALALVVFAWFMIVRDPMSLAHSRTRESLADTTPEQAAAWVQGKIGLAVPAIPLDGSGAKLDRVEVGDDWAAYDYTCEGQRFAVYVRAGDNFDEFKPTMSTEGTPQFVGPKGVGWRVNGLSFYLTGSQEMVDRMSCEVTKESMAPPVKNRLGVRTK